MKRNSFSTIALALTLLLGTAAGSTAQEPEGAAPLEVTGTMVEDGCPGGSSELVGQVEQNRGFVCQATWSTSDPRLDGTFTRAWNLDSYLDGTGLVLGYATGRLENDDGSWQQRASIIAGFTDQPELSDDVELLVFDGDAGHEGLLAVVYVVSSESGAELDPMQLHGYIVDADFPPSEFLPE